MKTPDQVIQGEYLHRWHIIPKNRFLNMYLHRFNQPDASPHTHDHPWWSLTLVLKGWYVEEVRGGYEKQIRPLRLRFRSAKLAHRVAAVSPQGCWTLFVMGRKKRDWGFLVGEDWVSHEDYLVNEGFPKYP